MPTKFVYHRGKLRASRDKHLVRAGSRLVADAVAKLYDEYIPKYARGRLIDLGCGDVPLYAAYKEHVKDNICVDVIESEHVDYVCDLSQPLPFGDQEFDTIILSDVLEHIARPEILWSEMARILAEGGKALINVPFYYWVHAAPHDYYRYTEWALRRFAKINGFEIVVLKTVGGSPEVVADVVAKHLQVVPVLGTFLSSAVQYLAQVFVRTAGKRLAEKTSPVFPLGYFMVVRKGL